MLTVGLIYMYFNFTINIFLLIVQTEHFAKTCHVDKMDWVLLRMPGLGYIGKRLGPGVNK